MTGLDDRIANVRASPVRGSALTVLLDRVGQPRDLVPTSGDATDIDLLHRRTDLGGQRRRWRRKDGGQQSCAKALRRTENRHAGALAGKNVASKPKRSLRLDEMDLIISQTEVMADLMDQDVGHQFRKSDVTALRPLVQQGTPEQEDPSRFGRLEDGPTG